MKTETKNKLSEGAVTTGENTLAAAHASLNESHQKQKRQRRSKRIRRGMAKSPLASLLVNEHDLPKRAKADRERHRQHVVRRTFITGGILDVIGEGEYTRIWIGRSEESPCLATLTQDEMREAIGKFQEALSAL